MQCGNDFCSKFRFWNRIFETKEKQLILNKCHIIAWWLSRVWKNIPFNHKQPFFMSRHKNFEIMWQASKRKYLHSIRGIGSSFYWFVILEPEINVFISPHRMNDETTWNWILIELSDNKTEIIIMNSSLQSYVYLFYEE